MGPNHMLNRQPFSTKEYTSGIASYDMKNKDDELEVPKYVTDIFQRLFNAEVRFHIMPHTSTVQWQMGESKLTIVLSQPLSIRKKHGRFPTWIDRPS